MERRSLASAIVLWASVRPVEGEGALPLICLPNERGARPKAHFLRLKKRLEIGFFQLMTVLFVLVDLLLLLLFALC